MPFLYYVNNDGGVDVTKDFNKSPDPNGYNINKNENGVNVRYFVPAARVAQIWHKENEDGLPAGDPLENEGIKLRIRHIRDVDPVAKISLIQGGGKRKRRKSKKKRSKKIRSKKKRSRNKSKKR